MNTKKGISAIKAVYMITLIGIIFMILLFIFYNMSLTILNDKSLEQQLIVENILSECSLNKEYGIFSRDEFTKEHISSCLEEFDSKKYSIRISEDILNSSYDIDERIPIILEEKEGKFSRDQQFCSIYSNKKCGKYFYSTLFLEENKEIKNAITHIEIIS